MESDSLSVASTKPDEQEVSVEENKLDSTSPISGYTSEERTDEYGNNRPFKKENTATSARNTGRSPANARGNRMRQFQSRGGVVNSRRFPQTSPPYTRRMCGLATAMGARRSEVRECIEPPGTLFSPRQRYPPSSQLHNADNGDRSTAADGVGEEIGGVRRRAKGLTSMRSSCEGSSPPQNSDVGDSGKEQHVQDRKEDQGMENANKNLESSEESSNSDSSSRDHQEFSAATPANDFQSSAPLRSYPTESGRVTYPLIHASPSGSISVILAHDILIEMSVDRCVRVVCHDKFSACINGEGSASCILHKKARILHTRDMVYTKFSALNDRLALIGDEGILFSMSHLKKAFLLSSRTKGVSAVSLAKLNFSSEHLENDFAIRLFYHEAQTGTEYATAANEIAHEASYVRKPDGTVIMHINGMTVRRTPDGAIVVDARPRWIKCSPPSGSVLVCSPQIEMAVEEDGKAYVKRGLQRVHVSRSGMLVSDGSCTMSMDHFGRIVTCR